jgi:hypothetical protein
VLSGLGAQPRVKVVGAGSANLARELSRLGLAAELGWRAAGAELPLEAAEMGFLGAARS